MGKDDVPNFIGNKVFKGTTYGPAEFLSDRGKRFRLMNHDELQKYDRKIRATKGFDVDGCTGCMPGRISPISPDSGGWNLAVLAAKAVSDQTHKFGAPPLKFVSLDKANIQPVEGSMYYLTFTAEDTTDQVMKTYQAKAWLTIGEGLRVNYFKEFKKPQKAVKLGKRKKQVASRASARGRKDGNLSLKGSSSADRDAEQSEVANLGSIRQPRPGELLAIGFSILLEDVRRCNPSWTYAEARSAASKKWRSLPDDEKKTYVDRADSKFKRKQTEPCRRPIW